MKSGSIDILVYAVKLVKQGCLTDITRLPYPGTTLKM